MAIKRDGAFTLSPFAVIAGTLVSSATLVLIMSTSSEWQPKEDFLMPPLDINPRFWVSVTTLAWLVSLALGAGFAAIIGNARTMGEGVATGILTWAASYLLAGGLVVTMIRPMPAIGGDSAMPLLVWSGFVGDILGVIVSALAAGGCASWLSSGTGKRSEAESTYPRNAATPLATP